MTMSKTLPGGPSKCSTSSARMIWPVDETGRNSVRPSTTPISTVFQISVRSIRSTFECLLRPLAFTHAAGLGALAAPEFQFGGLDHAVCPRQAIGEFEGLGIAQMISFGFLQRHATAASHFRQLLEGKDQQLVSHAQRRHRIGAFGDDR